MPGDRGRRGGADRSRRSNGGLRRRGGPIRDRRGGQAPALSRPRRDRDDVAERRRDRRLRGDRGRRPRPGDDGAMSGGEPVDWAAEDYHRVAAPQEDWGREVLARLDLRGDETVLDAGCGSGRVTRLLLERLPEGRVIGVDASPSMIDTAARDAAPDSDRVELIVSDLLDLELARAGRLDLLERDLPLDPRSPAAVRSPLLAARRRWAPRGAVRRPGQHRGDEAGARVDRGRRALLAVSARHSGDLELRLGR